MQQLLMRRQFPHQPMLHWDPPSTSRQEVSASGHAVIRFGRSRVLPREQLPTSPQNLFCRPTSAAT